MSWKGYGSASWLSTKSSARRKKVCTKGHVSSILLIILASRKYTPKPKPQVRKSKTFEQRLNEKKIRTKRRAMEMESRRWTIQRQMLATQVPHSPATANGHVASTAHSMATSSQSPYNMNEALRNAFPFDSNVRWMEAGLRAVGFVTPKKRSVTTVSQRSGNSEMRYQRLMDVIEWESE
jgi:hypothetical protein